MIFIKEAVKSVISANNPTGQGSVAQQESMWSICLRSELIVTLYGCGLP